MNWEGILTTDDEGGSAFARLGRWLADPDRYDIREVFPRQTWAEVVAEVGAGPVTERVKRKAGRMKVPAKLEGAMQTSLAPEHTGDDGAQLTLWGGAVEARKAIEEFDEIAKGLGAA